jgi:hypothetical protein
MRQSVCLCSFAAPWFFGPYGQQLKLLARGLLDHGLSVSYLYLANPLEQLDYSCHELMQRDGVAAASDADAELFDNIEFIGGVHHFGNLVFVSELNHVLVQRNIDAVITLMDLGRLAVDEPFALRSLAWFPNHFEPVSPGDRTALEAYTDVVALAPRAHELLRQTLPKKRHSYIPHVVDKLVPTRTCEQTREDYGIANEEFVALVNCGNYDPDNRKAIDTAVLAFEQFLLAGSGGKLFIHAYGFANLHPQHRFTPRPGLLNLRSLIAQTQIPEQSIVINEALLPFDEVINLMNM